MQILEITWSYCLEQRERQFSVFGPIQGGRQIKHISNNINIQALH